MDSQEQAKFMVKSIPGKPHRLIVTSLSIPPPLTLEKVPANPHRFDPARIIRPKAVHQIATGINL
jgi:hypothetical protein